VQRPDTYPELVAGLQPPGGSFAPQETVTSLAAFKTALAHLKAGDDYLVQGVTFSGETIINPKLSAYARFTFDHSCVIQGFTGSTWNQRPAIWLPEPSYIQLVFEPGCTLTNPRGESIIEVFGGHHIVLDGFAGKTSGGGGLGLSPVNADLTNLWVRGSVSDGGHNSAQWDPHQEKGSGVHAAYLANGRGYNMHDVTLALYTHDQPLCAGDIQLGSSHAVPYNFTMYVKADRLSWVSKIQEGGNAATIWGDVGRNIVFPIIEANDLQGFGLWVRNLHTSPPAGITVQQGTAVNTNQNRRWRGQNPWQHRPGVTYAPGPFTPAP
jgi:hypothetical protein